MLEPESEPAAVPFSDVPVLPVPKEKRSMAPDEFWAATKAYPRGNGTEYQLCRLYPRIDRHLTGHTKVALDIQPEMDEQYILSHWGSGHYQVFFNDANARPSNLASTIIELDLDWNHPPVLDQRELVIGHPKNEGYIEQLKARGLWMRDKAQEENSMAENQAAAVAVQEIAGIAKSALGESQKSKPADQAVHEIVSMMGTAYKQALSTIHDSRPSGDGSALQPVMELIIKRMDQQHEAFLKLLELRQPRNEGNSGAAIESQLGIAEKFMGFAEKLAARVSGAPAPSWMDRLPELIIGVLPALMARGATFGAMPPVSLAGMPGVPAPVMQNPAAPGAVEVDENMLRSMGMDASVLPFIKVGQRAIKAYQERYSGAAFAENVERVDGEQMYASICAVGKDAIMAALQKVAPMLGPAAAVVNSPEFGAWLDDFFAYGAEETEATPNDGNVQAL